MQNVDVYLNFINGQWKQGSASEWDENRSPARPAEILGRSTRSTASDASRAIEAAQSAFIGWSKRSRPQRAAILEKVAHLMKARAEQFAKTITMEQGKNLVEARAEVQRAVALLEFAAAEGARPTGEVIPSEIGGTMAYTTRVPVGVVGVITSWGFPLLGPASKIAPALLEANTVVFKPSTLTPATAKMLVFTFEEAGASAGVLNLVFGAGTLVGAAIANDPRVKAISFVGRAEVGREVNAQAAKRLARVQLEVSANNPVIVCADADLNDAVEATVQGAFGSSGQRGSSASRVLVDRAIHRDFAGRVVERVRRIRLGDGLIEHNAMGPLIDEKQYRNVLKAIEGARSEGCVLACGGEPATAPGGGRFVTPTVFDEVRPDTKLAREEIGGPVLAIIPVDSFEHAIEIANSFGEGGTSSIYTSDMRRIMHYADRVETGMVYVNSPTLDPKPLDQSRQATDFFSNPKTVHIDYR